MWLKYPQNVCLGIIEREDKYKTRAVADTCIKTCRGKFDVLQQEWQVSRNWTCLDCCVCRCTSSDNAWKTSSKRAPEFSSASILFWSFSTWCKVTRWRIDDWIRIFSTTSWAWNADFVPDTTTLVRNFRIINCFHLHLPYKISPFSFSLLSIDDSCKCRNFSPKVVLNFTQLWQCSLKYRGSTFFSLANA